MLINEVDAIPQRNCLNLSDLKKRRGSTQANTVNPEKPDVPLNKNDAFQKVQKRRVQEKR